MFELQNKTVVSCSRGWFVRLSEAEAALRWGRGAQVGGEELRWGRGAQAEDLLIALADRRSFPETRLLVARGMVGDTWSTESVVVVMLPASVLPLPVKDPGKERQEKFAEHKQRGGGG